MANSTQTVVSDGGLVLLDISFDYLDRSSISVYFDSVLTEDWAWVGVSDKQITFDPAVPDGTLVLVKRTTDLSALRHAFTLGAAFTAQSLDEDLKQVLHIAQEATEGNLATDFYGDVDMHLNRITNIANAVDPTDVPTFQQVEDYNNVALAAAIAADTSADAAALSEANALSYSNTAVASASTASTAATNAGNSATAAAASATSAASSATSATSSKNAAATSATNAANSATAAASSATSAASSASSATTQATNANTSAISANTSATNAASSEAAVAASATSASNSATAAASSATTASGAASSASASATNAAASATAAAADAAIASAGAAIALGDVIGDDIAMAPSNAMLGSAAYIDHEQMISRVFPVAKSAAYTVTLNDSGKTLVVSGTTTITLPSAADVYDTSTPFSITIKAITGATVTVARAGSDTIETVGGNKSMTANTALTFFPTSTSAWETQ